MPSLPVLFRVSKEENNPLDWFVRFFHTLGLSSKSRLYFHSFNQFVCQHGCKHGDIHPRIYQNIADTRDYIHTQKFTNFWTLPVPDQLLPKCQNENVAGLSNQRHKIRFSEIVFRKTTSRHGKTWERTKLPNRGKIITEKPKCEGFRSPDKGNSIKVQT